MGMLRRLGAILAGFMALGAAFPAAADNTSWQYPLSVPGEWNQPSAWSNGVPGPDDSAYIDNGGTATLASGDSAYADFLHVGNLGSGNYLQTGGTATFSATTSGLRHVYVGAEIGSTGVVTVQGGSFTCYGQLAVGNNGTGVVRQTNGLVSSRQLVLGFLDGGDGTYEMSGSSQLECTDSFYIGRYGVGRMTQDGGNVAATYSIVLGLSSPTGLAKGTYELRSGTVSAKAFAVGFEDAGTVVQSGGTMSITGYSSYIDYLGLALGRNPKSHGTYQLTAGSLLVERKCYVGLYGDGEMAQSGGTTDFQSDLLVGAYAQKYEVDYATGLYTQNAGTNRVRGSLYVAYGGARGEYVLSEGINTVDTDLVIGYGDHADGTYQVASGELAVAGLLQVGGLGLGCLAVHGASATISAGAYQQNELGTLVSVVGGAGISAIDVTGKATLGGTWMVLDDSACFGTFDVLTASGGIAGAFDAMNLPSGDWSWGITSGGSDTLWVKHDIISVP